jgi:hypothetical protein
VTPVPPPVQEDENQNNSLNNSFRSSSSSKYLVSSGSANETDHTNPVRTLYSSSLSPPYDKSFPPQNKSSSSPRNKSDPLYDKLSSSSKNKSDPLYDKSSSSSKNKPLKSSSAKLNNVDINNFFIKGGIFSSNIAEGTDNKNHNIKNDDGCSINSSNSSSYFPSESYNNSSSSSPPPPHFSNPSTYIVSNKNKKKKHKKVQNPFDLRGDDNDDDDDDDENEVVITSNPENTLFDSTADLNEVDVKQKKGDSQSSQPSSSSSSSPTFAVPSSRAPRSEFNKLSSSSFLPSSFSPSVSSSSSSPFSSSPFSSPSFQQQPSPKINYSMSEDGLRTSTYSRSTFLTTTKPNKGPKKISEKSLKSLKDVQSDILNIFSSIVSSSFNNDDNTVDVGVGADLLLSHDIISVVVKVLDTHLTHL